MEVLVQLVKNVLVIVILTSFLELLLPRGTMQKYVRFAIGLFIVVAVMHPILAALMNKQDISVEFWEYNPVSGEDILEKGQEINQAMREEQQQELQGKVAGQVSAVALLVPGVEEVETQVQLSPDGSIISLQLVVMGSPLEDTEEGRVGIFGEPQETMAQPQQEQIETKITGVLRNMYGLEDSKITIEFQGGN